MAHIHTNSAAFNLLCAPINADITITLNTNCDIPNKKISKLV